MSLHENSVMPLMPTLIPRLRDTLFSEAVQRGLADTGDRMVSRRKVAGGKSIRDKHIDDVWALVCAIQRDESVPRVLLKNGKRSKSEWVSSQMNTRGSRQVNGPGRKCKLACGQ